MQAPASARRELDAKWPLQPRPQHGPAAPLGQRSAGATAAASTLSSSPGGGGGGSALDAASASTLEAAEQGDWSGTTLIPDSKPALAATRTQHWPRWSHAPGGLAVDGADPDTRSAYPGEGLGDLDAGPGLRRGSAASAAAGIELALAGSGRREGAPLRHAGGAHRGSHRADHPDTEGVGEPQFGRTGHAMPLPAEEGFQPEPSYPTGGGSPGGRSGGRAGDSVPSLPRRDAAHGASGRGQAGGTGRGGPGWEGGSAGSADPQGAFLGSLGGMGTGQEEYRVESAEQRGPEARGAANAANPKGWLFGGRGSAAASAAVGTRGETPEGRSNEVRGVAGAANPQGGVFGYHGAAASALEESGADADMSAGLALEAGVVRAAGFPGRLSRHRSDRAGGDELDSADDDLPAADADSAAQGFAAALGSTGRLARPRSDGANALEAGQLELDAETEDAEDAEWAAGEADPEIQGFAVRGGASGRLAGPSAPSTVSALGRGSVNPVDAEDRDLAAENDAEEEDIEALYPAPAARGGAKGVAGDLWLARTATDQGLAQEAAARRDPIPVMHSGADFGGSHRGSSNAEQALADELQGRMNPRASPGMDPMERPGQVAEGAPHAELAAASQRVAGVLREREAVQANARVSNPSRAEVEGATAAPRAAWWRTRSTAGSAAAGQPRAEAGAGVGYSSGRADPDPDGKARSKSAEHGEAWAESMEHGHQHGADPGGLRVSAGPALAAEGADAESLELGYLHGADPDGLGDSVGVRAPSGPALDVEGADAGVLLDPPDTENPQDENSRRAPGPGWRWPRRALVTHVLVTHGWNLKKRKVQQQQHPMCCCSMLQI